MYDMDNEIIVCNSNKTKDIKDIEKAIDKLKLQEKKLVDLYLSSTINVETINYKNDMIKKEIDRLTKKKEQLDPENESKDYIVELSKKLDDKYKNNLEFSLVWDSLNRKAKKELINKLIASIEISRISNYDIEIKNVKFTEEFISKSSKEYLDYLNEILDNK